VHRSRTACSNVSGPAPYHSAFSCGLGQTAGLIEELAHSDPGRGDWIGHPEPGDVALDRRIELDLAGLHQLHDCEGGKRLRGRADAKGCLWSDGPSGVIGPSYTFQVDDLISLHDAQGQAWDARLLQLSLGVHVDLGEVRLPRARCVLAPVGYGLARPHETEERERGHEYSCQHDWDHAHLHDASPSNCCRNWPVSLNRPMY
jgi:hypothetical protein